MNFFKKASVIVAIMMLTFSAIQPEGAIHKSMNNRCVKLLSCGNRMLMDSLQKYLKYVGSYEIPIVAIQASRDTTHYFISAFISTYSIKKNPPTSVVNFVDRESLLYTNKVSLDKTSPSCYQYLLEKYSKVLRVDKLNRRDGVLPNASQAYIYDPILVDISITKNGHITAKLAKHFPFINYK